MHAHPYNSWKLTKKLFSGPPQNLSCNSISRGICAPSLGIRGGGNLHTKPRFHPFLLQNHTGIPKRWQGCGLWTNAAFVAQCVDFAPFLNDHTPHRVAPTGRSEFLSRVISRQVGNREGSEGLQNLPRKCGAAFCLPPGDLTRTKRRGQLMIGMVTCTVLPPFQRIRGALAVKKTESMSECSFAKVGAVLPKISACL